jgi:hypothetical protein
MSRTAISTVGRILPLVGVPSFYVAGALFDVDSSLPYEFQPSLELKIEGHRSRASIENDLTKSDILYTTVFITG